MNNKLKKFQYLKYFIDVVYIIFMIIFAFFIGIKKVDQLIELNIGQFLLSFSVLIISFLFLYYVSFFIATIWHELGHLIFGLIAKLKFNSFNIWCYALYIENNKLKIKKEIRVPDTAGYCYMELEENKKYNKNAIIFYFLGGIIFNFVLFAFLLLLTISTNNIFLKLICILNAIMNIYFSLHNLIPSVEKSGSINDGLHAMYFNNDEEYLGTMFKFQKLRHFIEMGIELKDIDRKLFSKPQKFQTISDIQNALIYIDYLLEKEQYNEVNKYAKKVLEEAKELLSNQDIIIIKLQLISSMFSSDEDISKIEEIWDEDIKRYLDLMENVNPIFIGYNYLYAMLVEKNEDNSRKYLNKFQQLNKKNYKKYELVEVEKIINEVNERIKK